MNLQARRFSDNGGGRMAPGLGQGHAAGPLVFLTALALSLGWGIRGNFGHEFGAMIPGALAAMAAVLLSGRADWWRRVHYFAFFGALGWSFGGSMSYMQVIAYTHSGHSLSVLYGFACLFVIGFLWAAMGGAGTALPALWDRERLTELFTPLTVVFLAWLAQDLAETWLVTVEPRYRHESPLYWYDTDWLAAAVAIAAVLLLALARRRLDETSALILHLAIGWWVGFVVFVLILGWRMTPPRGDNWAGCLGMVGGLLGYGWRRRQPGLILATLASGFIGGFGFAFAQLVKLLLIRTGWQTNWHSVLEQTCGFLNGLGIAGVMLWLAGRAPRASDNPASRRWTEPFAAGFVLLVVTYLNLRKCVETWVEAKAVPAAMYGLSAEAWFGLAYGVVAAVVIGALLRHPRQPLSLLPATWLGRGQLLFLVFLWWLVVGNFTRALVGFAPQRLATEGVIHLNAALCTWLVLGCPPRRVEVAQAVSSGGAWPIRRLALVGLLGFALSTLGEWAIVRAVYGDTPAGYSGQHIRFGPNATATKEKPRPGQAHP